MNREHIIGLLLALWLLLPASVPAQESVPVPNTLQRNVHRFNLSVDSLENLSVTLSQRTREALRELRLLQKSLSLVPEGSRAYRLRSKQLEEKQSEYMAVKHAMLQQMKNLRTATVTSLDRVLNDLRSVETEVDQQLLEQVQNEARKTTDKIAQTRIELLQILDTIQKGDISSSEKQRLTRKFHLLKNDNLALQKMHRQRLSKLAGRVSLPDRDLPDMIQSLLVVRDDLENRYEWIEAEMTYLKLMSSHRSRRLDIEGKVLEVNGLMNRFGDMVKRLNADRELMWEVEEFDRELNDTLKTSPVLDDVPRLQWPGAPTPSDIIELTPEKIDSLRQEIEGDLKSDSQFTN